MYENLFPSDSILWPLLHYRTDNLLYDEASWRAFVHVNNHFANVISRTVGDKDIVWIHDYHLFLLPAMLRKHLENRKVQAKVKIGFFLHVPFPSPDVFAALPVREQILESLVQCDLVGFHTSTYAQNFSSACSMFLGVKITGSALLHRGRVIKVESLPIGIDPDRFTVGLTEKLVQDRISSTQRIFGNTRLICGVDRLDFTKGIPHKLRAFEKFLTKYPRWLNKVSFVQVVVPSRERLSENRELKDEINAIARSINDKYRSLGFMPVYLLHRQVSSGELLALYAASDTCVITSLRDGMNLVASEYVASQTSRKGCLILSEFAGAAQMLDGCVRINPWNTNQVADAFAQALQMSESERTSRWQSMYDHVSTNTSSSWGQAYISCLTQGDANGITPRRRSQAGVAGQDMSKYYAS